MPRRRSYLIQAVALAIAALAATGQESQDLKQLNWAEWKERCLALPSNQQILSKSAPAGLSAISSVQFDNLLDRFLALELGGVLANETAWIGGKPISSFYDSKRSYLKNPDTLFLPFAQKLTLKPGSKVVFNGDLHGDIRSLVVTLTTLQERGLLDGFRVVEPDTHLVFLGDYTDRGHYGAEVIATLLRLKLENPGNVWLSRGNHEDFQLVRRYGFLGQAGGRGELQKKFGPTYDVSRVVRIFDCLPVVIYVGSTAGDFLQCNHGGMEPGFSPVSLLEAAAPIAYRQLGKLRQATFAKAHPGLLESVELPTRNQFASMLKDFVPVSPTWPQSVGFLWNDFSVFTDDPALGYVQDRGWRYGEKGTAVVLNAYSTERARVRSVFRAHQHSRSLSPLMQRLLVSQGVFRHWQAADAAGLSTAPPALLKRLLETSSSRSVKDGAVYTFNVSPDSVYGVGCYYNFTTQGILSMTEKFDDWRLEVVARPVAVD